MPRHYDPFGCTGHVGAENSVMPSLRGTSVIFAQSAVTGTLRGLDLKEKCPGMRFLSDMFSSLPLYWWVVLIVSTVGIVTICVRALETGEARAKSAEQKRRKEMRLLAEKISGYGQSVHQRYPTGDVVVSERDLAEQLRKRHVAVATALNLLLSEQKVQRAPLRGYWKLNG